MKTVVWKWKSLRSGTCGADALRTRKIMLVLFFTHDGDGRIPIREDIKVYLCTLDSCRKSRTTTQSLFASAVCSTRTLSTLYASKNFKKANTCSLPPHPFISSVKALAWNETIGTLSCSVQVYWSLWIACCPLQGSNNQLFDVPPPLDLTRVPTIL